MKSFILIILATMGCVATVFLLFNQVDTAMELDSLKEQIKLQRREMRFLENITNSALSAGNTTVVSFESVAHESKRDVLWQGDDALVGPFRVKKQDGRIVSIETVAGL